jgi:hypothetical protein
MNPPPPAALSRCDERDSIAPDNDALRALAEDVVDAAIDSSAATLNGRLSSAVANLRSRLDALCCPQATQQAFAPGLVEIAAGIKRERPLGIATRNDIGVG